MDHPNHGGIGPTHRTVGTAPGVGRRCGGFCSLWRGQPQGVGRGQVGLAGELQSWRDLTGTPARSSRLGPPSAPTGSPRSGSSLTIEAERATGSPRQDRSGAGLQRAPSRGTKSLRRNFAKHIRLSNHPTLGVSMEVCPKPREMAPGTGCRYSVHRITQSWRSRSRDGPRRRPGKVGGTQKTGSSQRDASTLRTTDHPRPNAWGAEGEL